MIVERILKGAHDAYRVFLGRRDIAPNAAKEGGAGFGAEAAGDFLFDFDHADISLGLIIVKRHVEVAHKGEHFPFVLRQSIQQILRWRLFRSASFLFDTDGLLGRRVGFETLL